MDILLKDPVQQWVPMASHPWRLGRQQKLGSAQELLQAEASTLLSFAPHIAVRAPCVTELISTFWFYDLSRLLAFLFSRL